MFYLKSEGIYSMEMDPQRLDDPAYRMEVFIALLQAHEQALRHYCVLRLGESIGDEVAQEVCEAVWLSLKRYQPEHTIRAWMFGIAIKKCLQAYRNRSRRATIAQEFVVDIRMQAHAMAPTDPQQRLLEQEQERLEQQRLWRLAACLERLPAEENIMVTLRYHRALPLREIATLLGIAEATVRQRLKRSLTHLRECISYDR